MDAHVFRNDLGTTNTVATCSFLGGTPAVVDIGGKSSTPPAVAFHQSGFSVGHEAEADFTKVAPSQILRTVKRIIRLPLKEFEANLHKFDTLMYKIVPDEESMYDGGAANRQMSAISAKCLTDSRSNSVDKVFRPETVSAPLLCNIRMHMIRMYNLKTSMPRSVICVPAYLNMVQRKATEAAGKMSVFHVIRVVNEPTAGAFSYALHGKIIR